MFVDKLGGRPVTTFIADAGMVFYDPGMGILRMGDGVTPGGVPVYAEPIVTNFDGGSSITVFGPSDFNFDGGGVYSVYYGGGLIDGGVSI
jgi:hypothetical protein